ncbi:MAG: aminotransferase class V-fold PLP-dependent enzyme [Bacillota bacterium]|nr:aminotransferase class V-fold PLP-dependent enzyme [Bacillota bacterium]
MYNSLKKYAGSNPVPFHMPGHKMGKGLPEEFLRDLLPMDVTEIPGMDNLHFPSGPIKQAQQLAAEAFKADKTYFLVNGSTCGIHAMIFTICKPGDKLIVTRDCHRSVIAGMMLAGVEPIYIKPEYNSRFGIYSHVDPDKIRQALDNNPDAVGVLITRPNYYGVCSDIVKIVQIVHSHEKLLIVDEAHGAHLCFNEKLPLGSMQAGVDMCVQSAHKTLPALTQSAYLHVNGKKIDIERLEFYLSALQTSSPSYILMAFLDIARAIMQNKGAQQLEDLFKNIEDLRETLKGVDGITLLGKSQLCSDYDQTRVVINLRDTGITGYEMEKLLRDASNIQVEMSDYSNVVCISTVADNQKDFEILAEALKSMVELHRKQDPLKDLYIPEAEDIFQEIVLKDMALRSGKLVNIESAAGFVSHDMIVPYPPGIPLICPGEKISRNSVDLLKTIAAAGGIIHGLVNENEIRIVK